MYFVSGRDPTKDCFWELSTSALGPMRSFDARGRPTAVQRSRSVVRLQLTSASC